MFTGTCFRHAENTIYFFSAYRNTSSCMAYAITKAGVRWFLDSYPMPVPLNLMALLLCHVFYCPINQLQRCIIYALCITVFFMKA